MIYIGDDISIEVRGNMPQNARIKYKDKMVGGIQEFTYILTVNGMKSSCILFPLDSSYEITDDSHLDDTSTANTQKEFAAELVRHGFSVIWSGHGEDLEVNKWKEIFKEAQYDKDIRRVDENGDEIVGYSKAGDKIPDDLFRPMFKPSGFINQAGKSNVFYK